MTPIESEPSTRDKVLELTGDSRSATLMLILTPLPIRASAVPSTGVRAHMSCLSTTTDGGCEAKQDRVAML